MWLRRNELGCEFRKQEILDEVEIDGVLWVEIPDEKGVDDVQPGIKREFSKNTLQVEACLEEIND